MAISETRFVSVKEYAAYKNIGTSAVYNRIRRGRLSFVELHGVKLININSYRPGKSGRPMLKK